MVYSTQLSLYNVEYLKTVGKVLLTLVYAFFQFQFNQYQYHLQTRRVDFGCAIAGKNVRNSERKEKFPVQCTKNLTNLNSLDVTLPDVF